MEDAHVQLVSRSLSTTLIILQRTATVSCAARSPENASDHASSALHVEFIYASASAFVPIMRTLECMLFIHDNNFEPLPVVAVRHALKESKARKLASRQRRVILGRL